MNVLESSRIFKSDASGARRWPVAEVPAAARACCEIHVLEPRWAAVVRFRAALDQLPRGFFHRYAALAASLIRGGQRPLGPPLAIFGKSDDNAVDVEAGLLIEQPLAPVDGIEVKRLPEGLVAALTHAGPYEQIGASYFELLGWMDDRSLKRDGPFMEVYLDGFDEVGPAQVNTRIVVPVCAPERSCGVSA
jgi:effector-binding domain-containing protein